MPKDCHIKGNCKQEGEEVCGGNCWKYIQLKVQYKKANIPADYLGEQRLTLDESRTDLDAYLKLKDYMENVFKKVKVERKGLFIYSEIKGNGKTSWAVKIMKEYFRQLHRTVETFEYCKGIFVNIPILFDELRSSFDEPSEKIKQLEKDIKAADLVIFDDIGTEAPTKWVKEKLYIFITHREMQGKPTIFTSNLTLETLESEELLGERIVDRIYKQVGGNIIEFNGPSRRRGGQW